ncbi:MAG: autotransporter outer membrane beta-barrel domain-containing protein [Hyphomicrobiales bacterium]|nr:autotransporter outer membrane beta-barrel domain-containing protein [Hyphomicrobiales bacterium]MCP5374425.1 autotransporter outer membrane beta-barrel domain-containing protein [Hyphomicrobiales bacterium]
MQKKLGASALAIAAVAAASLGGTGTASATGIESLTSGSLPLITFATPTGSMEGPSRQHQEANTRRNTFGLRFMSMPPALGLTGGSLEDGTTTAWRPSGGLFGMSAGDKWSPGVTFWGGVSYASTENDFAATAFDDDTYSLSAGVDKKFGKFTVGLYASASVSDTESSFNGGSSNTTTLTMGPYLNYQLNDMFRFEVNLGGNVGEVDNRRVAGAAVITGNQDTAGWFASGAANIDHWIGNFGLNGRLGYLFADSKNSPYVDSTATAIAGVESHFEQLQVSGQVSYYVGGSSGVGFLPYIKAEYLYDISREELRTAPGTLQPANDRDEIVLGAGFSVFSDGPISGGLSFTKGFARDQFDNWSLSGNVSYAF